MLINRIVKLTVVAGAAYMLGKASVKQKDEPAENGHDAGRNAAEETSEKPGEELDEFLKAGKAAVQKGVKSVEGFADALADEYHRQKKQ